LKGYPIFLIGLDQRTCVVVGGGREAERKIDGLLECDAAVRVIATDMTPRLRDLARDEKITWIARDYRKGDLDGTFLVIAAEQDALTNEMIGSEAREAGVLVNVMDDTEHCNFIAGSVVRQGALTVAISTNGCAPALAVRLRQRLQRELGPEYAELLKLMYELRKPLADRYPDFAQRRAIWYDLVDSDIIRHLRQGRPELARARALELAGDPETADRGY
jgi:siroheme synthase-like protein